MKRYLSAVFFIVILLGSVAIAASGTIDPTNAGNYKAKFLDASTMTDTTINFGKFTTEAQYNITVSDTELRGYAWGSSVGYIVMNCADTASGCSSTNGNFKVANDGTGKLSGYAWGHNTGWVNFGPFTNATVSTVKIDATTGNFGGTNGSAGYAWSQTYGWIVFDCSNASTCVNTDWRVATNSGGNTNGGGGGGSGTGTGQGTGTGTTTPPENPPVTPPENNPPVTPPTNPPTTEPTTPTTPTEPTQPNQPTEPPPVSSQPTGNPAQSSNEPGIFTSGLQLPPSLSEVVNNLADTVKKTTKAIGTAAKQGANSTGSKIASAVGVATTAASAGALLLLANPFSFAEFFLLPFRLWTLLLILLGFKKRSRPWGTVYDSVTKQPIDPAYVILMDMQGNEVATSITDIDGRYGFSVAPGTYRLIANKTNYEFPSKKLAGKESDELYAMLYFGTPIVIGEEGEIIAQNIPLDQQNFDWNQFAKTEQKRLSYYHRSDVWIARVANIFFWFGLAVAAVSLLFAHNTYNIIIMGIYVVMFGVRQYSPQFKTKGFISDTQGNPLSFAILHVLSVATGQEVTHKVADRLGNYYCLVPNGTYNIVIDRKNPDGTYTKVPISQPITVTKGYLSESFTI